MSCRKQTKRSRHGNKKNVADAFDQTLKICADLGLKNTAMTFPSLMNALERYGDTFRSRLREQFQTLAERVDGFGRSASASKSKLVRRRRRRLGREL